MPRNRRKEDNVMKPAQFVVVVSPDIVAFFQSAVINGTGGFQSLGRQLKEQLMSGDTLRMDEQLFLRVVRCAEHYGNGGFQTKLKAIAVAWLDQNFSQVAKAFQS